MAALTIAPETAVDFPSSPSNDTSADVETPDLHYAVWVFVVPVILLIGIIGNILSITVLLRKVFRYTTTGVYLPLTAVADITFLLTGSQEVFEVAGVFSIREYNIWTCRVYKVLFYTAGDVSIWLLVAFTFDRFIAVCFPLSKRRVCRWKRAATAAFTIIFLSFGKNLHEFWTRGPEYTPSGELRRICGSQERYYFFLQYVRPWIALILVMVLPFVLIFLFNCMIVHSLVKAQRLRNHAGADRSLTGSSGHPKSTISFRQTTFMCLGISFAFLICVAPSIVLLIGKPYWKRASAVSYENVKAICNCLGFVNHAINFILYCVTGRRFRQELATMLRCRRADAWQSGTAVSDLTPSKNARNYQN